MVGEGDPKGAGGAGGAGGNPQAPESGEQGNAAGAQPTVTHQVQGISVDILPEQLRNRPAAEIKFLLQNMVQATQNTAEENKKLKAELEKASKKEPPKEEKPSRPLEELILDDPEEAIAQVIAKRYGTDLGRLQEGYGESMFSSMRSEIPDFREHEDVVRELLKESGAAPTKENLMGAYLMSVGQKAIEGRRRDQQKQDNVEPAGGKPDETPAKKELTTLQKEVARGMGMSEEDYIAEQEKYEKGTFDIKVPTGQPREKERA